MKPEHKCALRRGIFEAVTHLAVRTSAGAQIFSPRWVLRAARSG